MLHLWLRYEERCGDRQSEKDTASGLYNPFDDDIASGRPRRFAARWRTILEREAAGVVFFQQIVDNRGCPDDSDASVTPRSFMVAGIGDDIFPRDSPSSGCVMSQSNAC